MSNVVEKISLNFTDLLGTKTGCTKKGSNKFWTGWVEDNGNGTANFEVRWGATGTAGSDKGSKRDISLSAALKALESKAKSKLKKGYTKVETRTVGEEISKAPKQAAPVAPTTRTFDPQVERLLSVIYNETSNAVRSGLAATAGATADNPIGNLSDRQLDKGGEVLDEIASLLESEFGVQDRNNTSNHLPLAQGIPSREIIDLTNRFMSNVPRAIPNHHRGRRNLHRVVVDSYERLEVQRKFLQLLRDAHVARETFSAAAQLTNGARTAVWYDGLNCDIEALGKGTVEFRHVQDIFESNQSRKNSNWWNGSTSKVRLARVFKFTRKGTDTAYEKYKGDVTRKMGSVGEIKAWHGTRTENLLGIGQGGLVMPENLPRGVHVSGKAFGRGIYHAPAWNATNTDQIQGATTDGTNGALKSLNYTSMKGAYYGNGNNSQSAFMFLQDVALGLGEVRTSTCWDKSRPDSFPKHDFIYANAGGCSSLTHDEIVTFDENAQVFRYLCEFEAR